MAKSAHWLGIGTDNLVSVKTDDCGRMLCDDLEEKIVQTIRENRRPFYVNATAGTTVMGAFDDLNAIADICRKYNLWMHVDVRQSAPSGGEFRQILLNFFFENFRLVLAAA